MNNISQTSAPIQKLPASITQDQKLDKAAKEFEAMFVSEMIGHMFNSIETDPVFGGGHGEDMFRSMMTQEYGKMMSHNGTGIGIAKHVKEALLKMQEAR